MNEKKNNSIWIAAVFIVVFGLWAFMALSGRLDGFDLAVQSAFFSARNPVFNAIACSLEYLGHWPLPAIVCLLMLGMKKTRFSYGIPLASCVLVSCGSYELLKHIFKRARPDAAFWLCQEHGFSFPSGHTLNNTVTWIVFASLLGYYFATKGKSLPIYKKDRSTDVYPKKKGTMVLLRVILIAWPLIISLSRVLAGVHWPSDVVGSWILAMALIHIGKAVYVKR